MRILHLVLGKRSRKSIWHVYHVRNPKEIGLRTFLEGIALRNYRGIGPEQQRIAPLSSMNLFIGANNAGKSIVLNFLANHMDYYADDDFARQSQINNENFIGEGEQPHLSGPF